MLTLTDDARTLVRALTDQADVTGSGGVRIAPAAAQGQLELSVTAEPQPGDEVVEDDGGARVFLEGQVAPLLSDSTLDAEVGDQPQFLLTPGSQGA